MVVGAEIDTHGVNLGQNVCFRFPGVAWPPELGNVQELTLLPTDSLCMSTILLAEEVKTAVHQYWQKVARYKTHLHFAAETQRHQ